ncbi:MAG TPA: primosomal protein N', partial [Rhodospirillaceae bacterium]|nr:primosomal protein N' [Rhodospirillaceae bacterium]
MPKLQSTTSIKNAPIASAEFVSGTRIAVMLPLPVNTPYDYLVPDDCTLASGDLVEVPVGRRFEIGVVWGAGLGAISPAQLKTVVRSIDVPPLPDVLMQFIDWVAGYTLQPAGAILRIAINPIRRHFAPKPATAVVISGRSLEDCNIRPTSARLKIIATVRNKSFPTMSALAKSASVSAGAVRGLVDAGVLKIVEARHSPPFNYLPNNFVKTDLEDDQRHAASELLARINTFTVTLLAGVTGSGKTEVYLEAVAEILEQGRQVLVLVPEIALTEQSIARFSGRLGTAPFVWHSDLNYKRRRETWLGVATGDVKVVIGARSALYLPFKNLGLIIVDEEHDAALKQEDGVIYHARDMAIVRAREGQIPIILATATPSIETLMNVRRKRYEEVKLPKRYGAAQIPDISLIDMRTSAPEKGPYGRGWLAPDLVKAIDNTLASGEQTLLFLNRRGYAPLTICRICGHRLDCPRCTAWLVEHRKTQRLLCHHCGYYEQPPKACPSCGTPDSLAPCGPGIERVAEEAVIRWPEAEIRTVASDTLSRPSAVAELVKDILNHRVDILIGTQVLAKGHHFPGLTLVGVVDADLGLSGWDLRAAERTHQLLHQVAGRAGRADKPGRVLLQTHDTMHPVMQALITGDDEAFIANEIDARQTMKMPPFGRLTALILSGRDEKAVVSAGRRLAGAAPKGEG